MHDVTMRLAIRGTDVGYEMAIRERRLEMRGVKWIILRKALAKDVSDGRSQKQWTRLCA